MRKFLYSPGYSAGWTSWVHDRTAELFALEYQPIIEYLEGGGKFVERSGFNFVEPWVQFDEPGAACLKRFMLDLTEHMKANGWKPSDGETVYCFCLGGADDLKVGEVADGCQIKIDEYEGFESYSTREEAESEWM